MEITDDYKVYVKTNEKNFIVAVNSSAFLNDTDGWTEIDSGIGDKFHHAQNNYFPLPLIDEYGVYRYKIKNGSVVVRNSVELDAEREQIKQRIENTTRIAELKKRLADTDYAVIKIAEGVSNESQYADILSSRKAWRAEINKIEEMIENEN